MEELGEKLCEIIAESPDVRDAVEEIREEGYSLYVMLDCKPKLSNAEKSLEKRAKSVKRLPAPAVFKINTDDLAFLKSVGIDPTRRCKARKNRYRASLDADPARDGD